MDERTEQALARQAAVTADLAEKTAPDAIGKAVLGLLAQGGALTLDSLLMELKRPVENLPEAHPRRVLSQSAQKALRDACPSTS